MDINGGGAELIRTAVEAQLGFNGAPLYSPRSAATLRTFNQLLFSPLRGVDLSSLSWSLQRNPLFHTLVCGGN